MTAKPATGDPMSPSEDPIAQRRFAFRLVPRYERIGDEWRAQYPGADWWVSAPSEDEARQRFDRELARRREAGENPMAFAEAVYRRHLREPVDGVYAMESELYRYVAQDVGYDWDVLQGVFEEAERRRAAGETYSKADYLAARRAREG